MATQSRNTLRTAVALSLSLLLAGCASFPGAYPGGGYGGDPYGGDRGYGAQVVEGSVQSYDPGSGRLLLAPNGGYGGGYGSSVEIWADRSTRLFYQGREQDISGLERGDRVRVEVRDDGRALRARTVEVTQNVRDGGSYGGGYDGGYNGGYGAEALDGSVRYVDTRRRVMELTRGGYSGRPEQVWYDERTRFTYRGQRVDPSQLESGDVVRASVRRVDGGWLATDVTVTVSARSR